MSPPNNKEDKNEDEPPSIRLQESQIDDMVSRLYTPEVLLSRTLAERKQKIDVANNCYTAARDPHLQNYWFRKSGTNKRTHSGGRRRLPPIGVYIKDQADASPATSNTITVSDLSTPASPQKSCSPTTSLSLSTSLNPSAANQQPNPSIKLKDLTAISILIRPPIKFRSMVHRLQFNMSGYNLKWVLSPSAFDVDEVNLLTLLTIPRSLEEMESWEKLQGIGIVAANKLSHAIKADCRNIDEVEVVKDDASEAQKREHRPPSRAIITSPRSALCCLRSGISPAQLLPKSVDFFKKEVDLQGAPNHASERRYRHFEKERLQSLRQLQKMYESIKETLDLQTFITLIRRFNPENDVGSVDLDEGTIQLLRTMSNQPPLARVIAEKLFKKLDSRNTGMIQTTHLLQTVKQHPQFRSILLRREDQLKSLPERITLDDLVNLIQPTQFDSVSNPASEGVSPVSTQQETQIAVQKPQSVVSKDVITKEEKMKEKCKANLERAKEKLQGHLIRTLLLKRKKRQDWEQRQEKMVSHISRYSEEKNRLQLNRQMAAKLRADACKGVLEDSRALAESRRRELVEKQRLADTRRDEVQRQRKYTREISREETNLRIKTKREGIHRQQNVNEWSKLCILDNIWRRHGRITGTEENMKNVICEAKFAREEMLRENEAVTKLLQNQINRF